MHFCSLYVFVWHSPCNIAFKWCTPGNRNRSTIQIRIERRQRSRLHKNSHRQVAITLLLITCCLSYGERRFALYLYSTCRTALALLVHPSTAAIRHTRRVSRRVLHKILFSDIQKKWNKIRMIFRHWSKSLYAACRQIVRANKCLQCLSIALSRVSIFCRIIIMASFDTKHSEHQFCILTTITYLKIIVMTASLT